MKEKEKRTVNIFKALGCDTRYKIIMELSKKQLCPKELGKLLRKNSTTISKHLKILRDLDIVRYNTVDKNVFYRLKKKELIDLIKYTEKIFSR